MFDFIKKFTNDTSKKSAENEKKPQNITSKPQTFERKSEEPRQVLNNGLSKQLFSDLRISNLTSTLSKAPENINSQTNEKKFKIFDDKGTQEEEKTEAFANYMNASVNFGHLKAEKPQSKEENFKEINMKEGFSKEIVTNQLSKNIINNTKGALESPSRSSNLRKKIFAEQPQKKMGDDILKENTRKNSGDLIAEKSLQILQYNQNAIMSHEDNLNMNDVLKEIDAHYFNENTEDNLIYKELLRLPKNAKIDEVASRGHYEKFGSEINLLNYCFLLMFL